MLVIQSCQRTFKITADTNLLLQRRVLCATLTNNKVKEDDFVVWWNNGEFLVVSDFVEYLKCLWRNVVPVKTQFEGFIVACVGADPVGFKVSVEPRHLGI